MANTYYPVHEKLENTHTHTPWTALKMKMMDRLSLSLMCELVSGQSDSGRVDPRTMITCPGAKVAQWLCLLLTDCMVSICLTSTIVHWQTFTMNRFKWETVVCQIPLSLPAEVDVDRHKDCDMLANQAGAASWVDFTDNQSTLTAACSCCACRSILHDISDLPRDMHAANHDVAWDRTVVGARTAWPSDFEDHPSVVSHSDLSETNKLPGRGCQEYHCHTASSQCCHSLSDGVF